MKSVLVLIIVIICAPASNAGAQINLVKNPGLEKFWQCPYDFNQIKYADYWSPLSDTIPLTPDSMYYPVCTPEYCNSCAAFSTGLSVPNGDAAYFHYAHSGNGMAQVQMYSNTQQLDTGSGPESYLRDYLQGRLFKRLTAGKQYCVSFFVVLEHLSAFSVNNIGAYIDDGTIDTATWCGWPQTTHTPQIVETSIISDTLNWTKVQGVFTATGNETFITIGNFTDSLHTLKEPTGSYWAAINLNTQYSWYLVDDISVIAMDDSANAGPDKVMDAASPDSVWVGDTTGYLPCYWYASGILIDSNVAGLKVHPDTTTTYAVKMDVCGKITYDSVTVWVWPLGAYQISGQQRESMLHIFPNPASQELTLTGTKDCLIRLYDLTGRSIFLIDNDEKEIRIDISNLSAGIYLLEVEDTKSGAKIFRKVEKD